MRSFSIDKSSDAYKAIVLFVKCLIIAIIPFVFNYCFVSDINSYTRIMLDEMHKDGYIDVLFLGASHTYRSYDVGMIEEETGLNVFNAGTSAQLMQGSYYLLKEVSKTNGVGTVYLDVTYVMQSFKKADKTQTYIIADYLKDRRIKWDYLYDAFGIDGIINGIFPFLHGYTADYKTLKEHIKGTYKNNSYEYVTYDNEAYRGQGFVYSFEAVDEDFVFDEVTYIDPQNPISDFSLKYLDKIITYCRDNNIKLVLVNPPMPDATLSLAKNFQEYVDAINEIAVNNNLEYMDFNLAKEEFLSMERSDYKDCGHLNGVGAGKFSECVCKILAGKERDSFYPTYKQKLDNNSDNTIN
ncbi:MAG: hypothetical protein MJ123_03270 [Lachnospiraceae bacterium]|nr:hypothetical protein [Lachnospiraceae bacterium]